MRGARALAVQEMIGSGQAESVPGRRREEPHELLAGSCLCLALGSALIEHLPLVQNVHPVHHCPPRVEDEVETSVDPRRVRRQPLQAPHLRGHPQRCRDRPAHLKKVFPREHVSPSGTSSTVRRAYTKKADMSIFVYTVAKTHNTYYRRYFLL